MKIKIGPYKNWIGPYQIAEKILFFIPKYNKTTHEYTKAYDKYVHGFGEWLTQDKNGNPSWLTKLCRWIESKRNRTIKVKIDRWDTWSMDHTLALIVLPMLKQLKETNHGAPFVDDEDVPEELRSTSAPPKENEWDTDANHFKRFEWVMDEMIWTFEQLVDDDNDAQFHSGNSDLKSVPCEWDEKGEPKMYSLEHGPNHTAVFDKEGYDKHNKRIQNGLRLFGRYYRNLWD